ncbi:MAG: hypothetical protein CBC16_04490 [Verrucomicrobia bacterium TMED56]|jgi:hypothetical protein|nr:MAG: hypothetical protein CBC16_04490 [Verrucomicrobia bacterium TMED56]
MNSPRSPANSDGGEDKRAFLGIHYVNCGVYGRLYKNKRGDAYIGHCPKCMHSLRVKIGPSGTGKRFFKCFCS